MRLVLAPRFVDCGSLGLSYAGEWFCGADRLLVVRARRAAGGGRSSGRLRPVTRRIHTLERRAGPLGHPAFAVIAYAGLLWLWHIPSLYDTAQGGGLVHALEHVCFAAAGTLYWWHLLSPIRSRMRLGGM